MKKMRGNTLSIITLTIILVSTAMMTEIQFAESAVQEWDTFAYVIATPNPVQVNQPLVVSFRIDKTNPLALIRTNLFTGFTVKITKPDGTTETKGPYTADSTSGSWFQYVPNKIGTYKFQTFFAGQWANSTGANAYQRWYKPSESQVLEVTVQENPIPGYSGTPPLPSGYWTRPIYGENKGWNTIADNWLMQGYDRTGWSTHSTTVFAPLTSAPNTPHVLWTRLIAFGGIVGEFFGDQVFRTGLSYEQFYTPLVLSGRIIYTEQGPAASSDIYGTRCIDLYTGEDIWYLDGITIDFAQTLEFDSGNEHGIVTSMWTATGANWTSYDAWSGKKIFTIANMTGLTGTTTFGPNGEIVSYLMGGNATNRWISMWNSTKTVIGVVADYWSPRVGDVYNGPRGIEWNVTIPDVPGTQSITLIGEGYALATMVDESIYPNVYEEMAYDLNAIKNTGGAYPTSISQLWLTNRTNHYYAASNAIRTTNTINSGVYAKYDQATMKVSAFDIRTGAMLWQSEQLPGGDWANFERSWTIAYGIVFGTGMDGHIYAWDAKTGELKWDYYFGSAGYENAYGGYPNYNGFTVADGKVFVCNDEHSSDAIMWRGGRLYCIDAYTGQGLWNISGWLRHAVISDGILTSNNVLDMKIYTIGKGPSATTLQTPSFSAIPLGTTATIIGKVTDQSPGQKDTPAICDENMSAWMEYLHMQKQMPINAKGVKVTLSIVDPNGNSYVLGDATSDLAGTFGYPWTPEVEGTYQITATFAGTNSYGSSYDTTYLTVSAPAAQPTTAPTQTPPPTETPIATPTPTPTATVTAGPEPGTQNTTITYVAITAVIAVVVIAAVALILRKRK